MAKKCKLNNSSGDDRKMALLVLFMAVGVTFASTAEEIAIGNVTRYATGDLFSIGGTDCGPTRCMELSHGTALAAMGMEGSCMCQCRSTKPAFREDQKICVNRLDECMMASFGRGTAPRIPFVFLPLKGQIIYPSNEIIFTEIDDAVCAVSSAQFLSPSGWVTLRDVVDNDVPFGLYRDEGNTFLQWRGSSTLHSRLEGRLVTAHVLCSSSNPTKVAASCAAFRIAGATHNSVIDVRSIPFHAGEAVTTEPLPQSQGLSVLESLAIGVCVLMLIFVYAAGIVFYVHYKKRQNRKEKDPEMNLSSTLTTENGSFNDPLDTRIDIDNVRLKTNPLLKLDLSHNFLHEAALSDVSEHTEDTIDSSPNNRNKFQKTNVVSAMVHTHRKKPVRPKTRANSTPERINERLQRRSASPDTLERAPHSELSIVDCSMENEQQIQQSPSEGETVLRRKLYFNPVFFETEHLKNPPPAAIDFLFKIREVMSVAKEKMTNKRFIPILSDIPEEESYHTIDLGWDIPCARQGRRFSAISLKRENSRRAVHCGGCPGCDKNNIEQKTALLGRSNSCKTCASEDYKQKIVKKWLDEVPTSLKKGKPTKSVAKVSGTPRTAEPKRREEFRLHSVETDKHCALNNSQINETTCHSPKKQIKLKEVPKTEPEKGNQQDNVMESITIQAAFKLRPESSPTNRTTRKVKKRTPPPPPPFDPPDPPKLDDLGKPPQDIKKKMEAVIRELSECRKSESVENIQIDDINPKLIIPIVSADNDYYLNNTYNDLSLPPDIFMDLDSLERNQFQKRRFSVAYGSETKKYSLFPQPTNLEHNKSLSWRDVRRSVDDQTSPPTYFSHLTTETKNTNQVREIFVSNFEPMYNNIPKPGPLTIEVRGSPVEREPCVNEDFDPDTLDRKPKKEAKKRVDKILLKSGGSFKHKSKESLKNSNRKSHDNSPTEAAFTRKIGSLRQIYEAKAKAQSNTSPFYERRSSLPNENEELPVFLRSLRTPDNVKRRSEETKDPKPPMPPKQRQSAERSPKFSDTKRDSPGSDNRRLSEERDRFPTYSRTDNLSTRRSSRRSARTRSRRTDLRKLCRTEDSGYLSTDSNESKYRARYFSQMRPKSGMGDSISSLSTTSAISKALALQLESDTDDLESLCDGLSESGGESIETDSVFFGNVDDSKQLFCELRLNNFSSKSKSNSSIEHVGDGLTCETNIIMLSGDSDSEHRSVISIIAGHDGRTSRSSISTKTDES